MARPVDERIDENDPGAKLPREDARQGQNVKGMVAVLVVGVVLVAIAYAIMLAFQSTPVDPSGVESDAAGASSLQETVQSP